MNCVPRSHPSCTLSPKEPPIAVTLGYMKSWSRPPCHYISQSHFCIKDILHTDWMRIFSINSQSVQSLQWLEEKTLAPNCTLILFWSTIILELHTPVFIILSHPIPCQFLMDSLCCQEARVVRQDLAQIHETICQPNLFLCPNTSAQRCPGSARGQNWYTSFLVWSSTLQMRHGYAYQISASSNGFINGILKTMLI